MAKFIIAAIIYVMLALLVSGFACLVSANVNFRSWFWTSLVIILAFEGISTIIKVCFFSKE